MQNDEKKTAHWGLNERETLAFCQIGGLSFASVNVPRAADLLWQAAQEKRSCAVFTAGAVMAAASRQRKNDLLRKADLLLPDGRGLFAAARLSGAHLGAVCPGIDLGERLLAMGNEKGARFFFYGGKPSVAHRAAEKMMARYPALVIESAHGYAEAPLARMQEFSPCFVFVCLGFPRQEEWILKNLHSLSCPMLGLGGSFDVWSGDIARAPRAFRRLGLEWLWRSVREPRRIPRLFPLLPYFCGIARESVLQKFQKKREKHP